MMKNKRATRVITQSSLDSTDGAREVGASWPNADAFDDRSTLRGMLGHHRFSDEVRRLSGSQFHAGRVPGLSRGVSGATQPHLNKAVTMTRTQPLTLGGSVIKRNLTEVLCLLCQSEVADQMGDLSTMQATLRFLRSGSSKKRNLPARLALLVMLAAGTPAPAADTIEELLREDEASSQNDALRVDLNALTEAEWEYYFQVGLKKVDTQLDGKLVEHESDWSLGVFYVWIAALAAGFGIAMGAIKAWPSMRRVLRILLVPVPMEDLGRTIAGYAGYEGTRL
jgi:hypothetical protein